MGSSGLQQISFKRNHIKKYFFDMALVALGAYAAWRGVKALFDGCSGIICFHPDTAVTLKGGKKIAIKDLEVGQKIRTLKSGEGNVEVFYTEVTENICKKEACEFVNFQFEDGSKLSVTPDHLMYTIENNKMCVIMAGKLKVDAVVPGVEGFTKVTKISKSTGNERWSVDTESKTLLAGGIFVTSECEFAKATGDKDDAIAVEEALKSC